MEYRSLGESGLKVSPICLGTMMFGDRTDAAEAARIVASAREAGVNFIDTADVYAKGESERITGKLIAPAPRALGARDQGREPDGRGPERPRAAARAHGAGDRREPRAPAHRLHRPLLPAQGRRRRRRSRRRCGRWPASSARARCATRRSRTSAPGASREVMRVCRRAQHAAAGRAAAVLQRDEPHARGRGAAGVRVLRPRRRALQPARARRAHRQVQARREAARGVARRAQRQADACRPSSARSRWSIAQKMAAHAKKRGITPGPFRHGLGARQRAS